MSIPHHSTHRASLSTLLSTGVRKTDIATELGLTPSAVTQLATSQPQAPISQEHQNLDNQYDRIEQKLLDQLERTTPLLLRPMEIAKVLTAVNGAKRRGGPLHQSNEPAKVLSLNIPVVLQNRFVLNQVGQVVSAGAQDLVTIPSASLAGLAASTSSTQPKSLAMETQNETHSATSTTYEEFGV